jgi:superfamily I DNA and RNA helicase
MLNVIWGSNKDKPESARALAEALTAFDDLDGYLYIGYPVMGSPLGPVKFDALAVTMRLGLIAFDLVEGVDVGDFVARQDEAASMLDVKLKPYPGLKAGRKLRFEINTITFAPAKAQVPARNHPYLIANRASLESALDECQAIIDPDLYQQLLGAVQVVTTIRAGKVKREPKKADSRGARLKRVEESIANLDQHQSRAVIETVDGVQRIRGLAGSGKTIILALKVAYLHSQNPEWRMAVTFNTRSLKEQFRRLINFFTIEQTGTEPDWEQIDIINAWGAPGDREDDGIYHKFCRDHGLNFLDFGSAKAKYGGGERPFTGVCAEALQYSGELKPRYDIILVDEAQDFPPEFLRLCYRFLLPPKRLVYAYDELQSLTGIAVLPPQDLFGRDEKGQPLVEIDTSELATPRQDVILEKCYRNPRPVLTTAHAIGFGVYRDGGLVQIFDEDALWTDVGYVVEQGALELGKDVTLARTSISSPLFLEEHSSPADLVQFLSFSSSNEQTEWLVKSIQDDINDEELRPEDIVVINPDPLTTRDEVGPARRKLFTMGINSEIAGVSTSRDVFSKVGSVTFAGVFRAKGNEAGMVYIINAHDCFRSHSKSVLALNRNRLFTAITRSKAWVRVLGVGARMDGLKAEWEQLASHGYKLAFKYPTAEEKAEMRLINIDPAPRRRRKAPKAERASIDSVLEGIARGNIDPESLIEQIKRAEKARRRG